MKKSYTVTADYGDFGRKPSVIPKKRGTMAAKKAKPFVERKTGERYASKTAMKRHEKGESKSMQRKEMKRGK